MKLDMEPLIHAYMDGTISHDEMARLNALLLENAEARREFAELLNMDSALAALAAGWEEEALEQAQTGRSTAPSAHRAPWLMATVCVVILMVAAGWWWQVAHRPFATVESVAGAAAFQPGASLHGELHELHAGTLSLITRRGAHVVIEAPASFRFESAQRLRISRGRLAADVPPSAKGFTVVTPSGDAIDLGTRFGVDVPAQGAAEIHVFQGEVIAKATGARQQQSLRGGDAVTMDQGSSTTRELRNAAFIQPDEVSSLKAGLAAGQRTRAEAALQQLREDPALIALMDFEAEAMPGEGVYRMVQGRWPGSRAPEFVQVGDHLKLDVGGDRSWPQLTLAAWVRIDRLGEPYQSLLHTDGWSKNNPGQVHWMITQEAVMRLALIGNTLAPGADERQGYPDSRTPVLPEQGRWMHVAVVYDSAKKSVRFYLNGRLDKETRQEIAHPARLGPAQIGNWNQRDRKLSGRVDELLILGRAMTDDEVHTLHTAGNPYR
ncbi:FecR family protein [Roseimicrobium gellanilyticum]|uniref:FecR family protein n=1 Tax=Roseimicrobium gellanilyticum TaxID=748857 RepID=A0A366H5X8_9BACT|nr:LamG-like jellyroll fold domain-containing protein [Roseimicrobium gellanilyticum]RBP37363.1 FecR family protein [Roseimicrobium gellanilyticum]